MCIRDRKKGLSLQTVLTIAGLALIYLLAFLLERIPGIPIMPVSYTHLDVYKRQP